MAARLDQKVDWRWYYQWKSQNTNGNSLTEADAWAKGKVCNFYRNCPCSNPAGGKIYGTPSLLFEYGVCEAVFWRRCIGRVCQ